MPLLTLEPAPGERLVLPVLPGYRGAIAVRLLGRLEQECQGTLSALDAALQAQRPTDAADVLHSFKGAAGNMRAAAASAHAAALEAALHAQGLDGLHDGLPAFRAELLALGDAIRRAGLQ